MRFKTYLAESGPTSKEVTKEQAYAWIKKNAKHYINALFDNPKAAIFRGMRINQRYAIGDSSTFNRKAANTTNETNALVSSSPKWKDYPRRDQAWICSSNEDDAWAYGMAFLVIPSDNAQLGICPDYDFWYSFYHDAFTNVSDLNEFFGYVRSLSDYKLNPDKITEFRMELSHITSEELTTMIGDKQGYKADKIHNVAASMERSKTKNLLGVIEYLLDPERNGFSHTAAEDYDGVKGHREIWIRGECVFIQIEHGKNGSNTEQLLTQLKEELYAV